MTWFKVDDQFHSHPKAAVTSLAARGLWVTAGSWSSAHLTDGVVPDHVLALLGGTPELAAELVAAGLWRRARTGYRFHDWHAYQPTKERVTHDRQLAAQRQSAFRQRKKKPQISPNGVTGDVTRDKRVSHKTPTRPDPPPTGVRVGGAPATPGGARPDRCPHHRGQPAHNCGICRAEQLAPAEEA